MHRSCGRIIWQKVLEIDVGDLVEYAYKKRASDGSCYMGLVVSKTFIKHRMSYGIKWINIESICYHHGAELIKL